MKEKHKNRPLTGGAVFMLMSMVLYLAGGVSTKKKNFPLIDRTFKKINIYYYFRLFN